MAEPATTKTPVGSSDAATPAADAPALAQPQGSLEMSDMEKDQQPANAAAADAEPQTSSEAGPAAAAAPSTDDPSSKPTDDANSTETPPTSPAPKGKEKDTGRPRGDSLTIDDAASPSTPSGDPSVPMCNITLLLPTGARHPYRIDEKYLSKRNVEIPDLTEDGKRDPFSISIYKLKELILREWRDEWEVKPASPSSIRLIHFGKLLDDKEQLKKYQFTADTPNVIHMSVRPAEMLEEDEGAKGKSSGGGGRTRESGGCCVIL